MPPAAPASLPPVLHAQLLAMARAAARGAYCPYSNFHVGAAVLADGRITTGCNVENASYGLTICAERNAIFAAVAGGATRLDAVAVCCADAPPDAPDSLRVPCGACRQVLAEFGGPDLPVIIDGVGVVLLRDLLPHAFVLREPTPPAAVPDAPRPRLGVDLDNVLTQADVVLRSLIREVTQGRVNLAYEDVVQVPYRMCRDANGQAVTREEWRVVHDRFAEPDAIAALEPIPGALDALNVLAGHYELHLATARPPKARAATVGWLDRHGVPRHSLHFLAHGERHRALGRLLAAVEDDRDQAEAFARAGVHSFLLAHPWNEVGADPLVHRVATWAELTEALRSLVAAR